MHHANPVVTDRVNPPMVDWDGDRLGDLARYALGQHAEHAGGVPVLVVEKPDGRRKTSLGRSAEPAELARLVAVLEARTARVDRRAALVWSIDPGASESVRYAYCVTPDHRQGILLARRYSGAAPVGDPEPVDRWDLPAPWRPAELTPQRSPAEKARASPQVAAVGPVVSFVVGMFIANVLVWLADRIGGTDTVGATVVDKGFTPGNRGNDYSIELRSDGGDPVRLDDGDVQTVWRDVAAGDHIQVLTSGFTGRPVGVETARSAHYLAGGWGEPVAWLLLCLVIVWVCAKALTWPRLRWSLVRVAPLGILVGGWLSLIGVL